MQSHTTSETNPLSVNLKKSKETESKKIKEEQDYNSKNRQQKKSSTHHSSRHKGILHL